jgi:hypothetical protein
MNIIDIVNEIKDKQHSLELAKQITYSDWRQALDPLCILIDLKKSLMWTGLYPNSVLPKCD